MNEGCFASEEEGKGHCRQRAKHEQRASDMKAHHLFRKRVRTQRSWNTGVFAETGGCGLECFTEAPLLKYFCRFLFLCIPSPSLI